jgi:hypothetical protein
VDLTIIGTERVALFAEGTPADLPSIALTNYNPGEVALFVHGSTIDVADVRLTPSSDRTYILADGIQPIDLKDMIFGMPTLEIVRIRFFDLLAAVRCSVKRIYTVFRIEGGNGDGIVLIECFVELRSQGMNLLLYFWIDRLLGEGRPDQADDRSQKHT